MRNQSSVSNKENRPTLERRLSLKHNCSSNSKNAIRMSIPTRRESISTATVVSMFNDAKDHKQTRQSFTSCMSLQIPKTTKKDAILTNLMKKLDHEEELKEIIHSKIRSTKEYEVHCCYDRSDNLEQKLKNCQKQLQCFKDMVKSLMEKISSLEKQPRKPKLFEVSTQTEANGHCQTESSLDFMQNLDKTLKVLSGKKNK